MEHHAAAVPYEWEESLGWEKRPPTGNENFQATDRRDWWYHWKSPALLKANPQGMVPTLLEPASGRAVTESIVCIEFIDELAQANGSQAPTLLPSDPFERARARVAADRMNKTVTSSYYRCLVREYRPNPKPSPRPHPRLHPHPHPHPRPHPLSHLSPLTSHPHPRPHPLSHLSPLTSHPHPRPHSGSRGAGGA